MEKLILPSNDGEFILAKITNNKCDLSFESNGHKLEYGSDSCELVLDRICDSLVNIKEKESAGYIDNISVGWVTSMPGTHVTIYAGCKNENIVFYFQDCDGNILNQINLEKNRVNEWVEKITNQIQNSVGD